MNKKSWLAAVLAATQAIGAEPAALVDCAGVTDVKSKSRQFFESKALTPVLRCAGPPGPRNP